MSKTKYECIEERAGSTGTTFKVHIPYYDELGIRRFYSKSFPEKKYGSKQRALEYAKKDRDAVKVKLANKMIVTEKKASLRTVFDEMMDLKKCKYNTRRKDTSLFNHHILDHFSEDREFKSIRFTEIQTSLNDMTSCNSDDNIKRTYGIWRRMFAYAMASDICFRDETVKVSVPESELIHEEKNVICTLEDVMYMYDQFRTRLTNERDRILYSDALLFMWYAGMRPAEVFALNLENIDLENGWIYVRQAIGSSSTERNAVTKPKTKNAYRDIPIADELMEPLSELIPMAKDGYLFMKDSGEFVNGSDYSCKCNYLSNGRFNAYMLRHTFINRLKEQGTDLRTQKELAGHSSSSMTVDYQRSNGEDKKRAIRSLSDSIGRVGEA